jgi:hypothetical protein
MNAGAQWGVIELKDNLKIEARAIFRKIVETVT